jgi:SAM-dependent methyltransferase
MSGTPADRIAWAVDILAVRPDDAILEMGCGRGRAVQQVCEQLVKGLITAIDRSETMVEAARELNAPHIAKGRATILHADLLDADLPAASFDKIFLININVFWMDPVEELHIVRRLLRPEGRFYIFHQPPPGHDPYEFAERFQLNLTANGFEVIKVIFGDFVPVGTAAVISAAI